MRRFDSEPKIVEYKDVKKLFLNKARELGVTVSKSDKKNLMPKVSNMFPEINFVTHQYNKMIMYPNTLAIGKTVLDFLELKTKLELLKGPRSDDEKNVIQIARLINDEIKDLNPQMSWMPKEDDLKPSRTTDYIPHLLDVFLTGLITAPVSFFACRLQVRMNLATTKHFSSVAGTYVHGLVVTVQAARRITGGTCSSFLLSVLFLLCVFFFYCCLLFRYCSFVVFLYTA